jgi:hypothetical protein
MEVLNARGELKAGRKAPLYDRVFSEWAKAAGIPPNEAFDAAREQVAHATCAA